jgi:hypothetical protein
VSRVSHVVVGTTADTTITVTRSHALAARPQGLVLEADQPLEVADTSAPKIVLWAHTAPAVTHVRTTAAGEIRIWHVWRDGELIQSWTGGAGMEIDDRGDDLGLRCHDGHPGDGPDLEVRLSFDRAWTQPAAD